MTVIYPRFDQTPASGFDDLDGLLCVQRRLKFKSGRNEIVVFAAVVEPKLLAYSTDSTYRTYCYLPTACKTNVSSFPGLETSFTNKSVDFVCWKKIS